MTYHWETPEEAMEASRIEEERLAQAQRERQYRLRAAVVALQRSDEGREFLSWLFEECHVFNQEPPHDRETSIWNAGRRAFGLEVLHLCAQERMTGILLQEAGNE